MVASFSKPISSNSNRAPYKVLLAFFGFFFLFGSVFAYLFLVRPLTRSMAAKSWVAVPCVIEESGIESHPGDKGGATYSIAVKYRYQYNGQSFTSTQHSFDEGSSSLRGWRDEAVAKIPPGA